MGEKTAASVKSLPKFVKVLGALELIIILIFITCTELSAEGKVGGGGASNMNYALFQDVHVMIFIGFGFLMTFLKSHSWTAVGFNFLVAAFSIQLGFIFQSWWHNILDDNHKKFVLNTLTLTEADFSAAAVLISFGAVLGKLNALQLVVMAVFELFFFSININLGLVEFKVADVGGSVFVHAFGSFFGLAVTKVLSPPSTKDHPKCGDSYNSNLFAMIGTIFLWMFWPSFNGALTSGSTQQRVVVNTVLALTGSCIATFLVSAQMHGGKFVMEDILNASLAGGVAIGTSADILLYPGWALLIGAVAGIISCWGFEKLGGILEAKYGIYDTCGVNNLHGIPGVIGGLVGALITAFSSEDDFNDLPGEFWSGMKADDDDRSFGTQAGFQFLALVVTLAIAIVSGYLTGKVITSKHFDAPDDLFDDKVHWEMEDAEPIPNKA